MRTCIPSQKDITDSKIPIEKIRTPVLERNP